MPKRPEGKLELPRLILCEGPDDVGFFRTLIDARELTNWHVRHTGENRHDRGGRTRIGEKLRALQVGRSGFEKIQKLIVAVDADHDHAEAFQSAQQQLAFANLTVPNAPHILTGNAPAVAVLIMPMAGPGNLECVCGAPARQAAPHIAAFVDQFVENAAPHNLSEAQRGKMWLRVMMAARWTRDPMINLGSLFHKQGEPSVIPMIDQSLKPISDLLQEWAA